MLIVGAKGFAKEVLLVLSEDGKVDNKDILFFDNISNDLPEKMYNKFRILKSFDDVSNHLSRTLHKNFVLGIGNPIYREKMYKKFVSLGAFPTTLISNKAEIGTYEVSIGKGSSIMAGSIITNSITIGKGCLINLNCTIGHDSVIGDFVEMSPNVNVSGRCVIGNLTSIGTSAIILPDIKIGNNVIVGAGSVVLKDIQSNVTVVGNPARIIKHHG